MVDLTQYGYIKKRTEFGRQPLFNEVQASLLDSISADPEEFRHYGLRNPVHKDCQHSTPQSEHEANTIMVKLKSSGVRHTEGGWPKDVNPDDEEATARHRRRWEKDDSYARSVQTMAPVLERFISQNNAVEIYEKYFTSMPPEPAVEKSRVQLVNSYADPFGCRSITEMGWTAESDPKVVVAYCVPRFQLPNAADISRNFCVWDLDRPKVPLLTMTPSIATAWRFDCNYREPNVLVAGLTDGKVAVFDLLTGPKEVAACPAHCAHRHQVSDVHYTASRTHTEFFSGSTGGQCLWWDTRNLSEPFDQMTMTQYVREGEEPTISNAIGVTSLLFEKAYPARFFAGLENGLCVNVNRKGRTQADIMSTKWAAHSGPCRTVRRNPFLMKLIATCGDWSVRLWNEDTASSYVFAALPGRAYVSDVVWATQRVSGFMTACSDGHLHYWDLLRNYDRPIVRLALSEHPLTKLSPHEDGKLVVVGDAQGDMTLISLSDNLVFCNARDRVLMTEIFEREIKREHILDFRVKEISAKKKQEEEAALAPVKSLNVSLSSRFMSTLLSTKSINFSRSSHFLNNQESQELELIRIADLEYKQSVEADLRRYSVSKPHIN